MGKRDDVDLPKNYYYNDDPMQAPLVTWRAHANLFLQQLDRLLRLPGDTIQY